MEFPTVSGFIDFWEFLAGMLEETALELMGSFAEISACVNKVLSSPLSGVCTLRAYKLHTNNSILNFIPYLHILFSPVKYKPVILYCKTETISVNAHEWKLYSVV